MSEREAMIARAKRTITPPLKPGAPILAAVAFAIFRASFAEDESEDLVWEKWFEWEDDRAMSIRRAKAAIRIFDANAAQAAERAAVVEAATREARGYRVHSPARNREARAIEAFRDAIKRGEHLGGGK